ncbi:thiamine diphosphokinase [Phaeovulum sp.]|uniref:thiamine diphosphokinase n=1 Tax=Phaeovulum sp. TaxID=2934796 RepID=UPI0027305A7D|nr:thiamine diphosphokinase [Phaeovulum sp.]MDP1669408.1 thiamine diphosphokinase [Phaeovulum sp.]MDZ4119678.1 thiamine diphosphokinase [Phaeovulum sp.]
MNGCIVHSGLGVTLLGAGEVNAASVTEALTIAPCLVAADGGADRALALGLEPEAVLGDLDSISPAARAAIAPGRLHRIAEQEGTDFDKCLAHVEAPFFLALGFGGGRLDHTLAAMATLARHPGRRLVWVGGEDVAFLAPPVLALDLIPGTRVSLFPMGRVRGRAEGLRWPLEGADFGPAGRIGTSNEATGAVLLRLDGPMLVLLPLACLSAALAGLGVPLAARGG